MPASLDTAIRERARVEGKSLNEITIEALADGLGVGRERSARRDLGDVAGSWKPDAAVEAALAEQDRVDPKLWK